MQDPSYGVAQPLQNHIHLISGHRYPIQQSLNLEQAFRHLLEAPSIVSKIAPMSWIYVQAPQDGTVWLEWISPRNGDNRFPSDGYIWGDAESTYRQEFNGYTIELMVHAVGYRPGHDHHASHARTRYHFIAKNPAVNAAPPDPSLWLVHYHQTDPARAIPSPQVPISPFMSQVLGERKTLEAQGRIERRDFMLHDREHWPTINLPGARMQQPGFYGNPNMSTPQNRYPNMPGYQQPQGPPSKRPRFSGPAVMPGAPDGIHDTSIEDEENIALGDFFDHLTPREISWARFSQHHQWIEEVFSSPYASSKIVPPDLGLGLMGELKGLTEGLLETPTLDAISQHAMNPPTAREAQPFTNLKQEQVEEFNRRVEEHLKEGKAEIERMKEEHAAKMNEWTKSKKIMQAEKRLRYATWEGHEGTVPVHRVDVLPPLAHGDQDVPRGTVEDVIKDVETLIGRTVTSHKDATVIQEGGLEKEEEISKDRVMQDEDFSGQHDMLDASPLEAAASQTGTPAAIQQLSGASPSVAQPVVQTEVAGSGSQSLQTPAVPANVGGLNGADAGDDSIMGGMDIDVDNGLDIDGVDFGDINDDGPEDVPVTEPSVAPAPAPAPAATPPVSAPAPVAPSDAPAAAEPSPAPVTTATAAEPQQPEPSTAQPILPPTTEPSAPAADVPPPADTATTAPADDSNLFDDNTFADLADMDGGGDDDDGLLDFDGGMGIDDSAFGDAMHGMDDSENPPAAAQPTNQQDTTAGEDKTAA